MTDQNEEKPVRKRGEAAWKEARDRIAERNEQVSKAGRKQREDYERARIEDRVEADVRRRSEQLKRSGQK